MERERARVFGASAAAVGVAIERLSALGRLIDPLLASAITLPPQGFWERREVGRLESLLPRPHTDLGAPLPAEHPFRTIAAGPAALSTALAPHEIRARRRSARLRARLSGGASGRGRAGRPARFPARAPRHLRRRPARAAQARRDRRPARSRGGGSRAPPRRDHRLPPSHLGRIRRSPCARPWGRPRHQPGGGGRPTCASPATATLWRCCASRAPFPRGHRRGSSPSGILPGPSRRTTRSPSPWAPPPGAPRIGSRSGSSAWSPGTRSTAARATCARCAAASSTCSAASSPPFHRAWP